MQNFANIEIAFIHRKAPLPSDFSYPEMPGGLTEKQVQKWQSRRVAFFLLTELFKKHHLDLDLLADMQRSPSGRTFVDSEQIDFNISHSGEWIAVIFSYSFAKLAVGIDIEHPQKIRRYHDLICHYGNAEEQNVLLANHSPILSNLAERFYLSWCLREAILKSQGVGIVKLSEVKHLPLEKQIFSAHCPKGKLHFVSELPFYLSYFYQQPQNMLLSEPLLYHWQNGQFQPIKCQSLVYDVN
ncbi:TPA: 4'-phosphopantetheinyl transferase superfamily protein [Mannheimia haemolytica]|uniref:4'-phosphopantetheinyl transferase superfamily protein n=1 Tax=Mannheimia haemolytica TaxID=75985 RepID=A0A249A2Y9_MANHA|nr:4'-phosphopantetheinyl transferase superfamily protein [Mannheimia haemolytica]AWW72407.1 4'-phosphopantetheinyl transferase [Pasteurellaceae bacterium 12565]AGI33722.2 4'-phosphopantetheinyl transferase [Mannheimia haemolytica USDA-ARS-USMARC-183]AGI34365.2 4'-phosphopantetheinyl transferase [Mannheimia haemolytica USDA-ARS-USMARC-185]AGK01366.1 putative holo-[acyl carrier protein] synthase [Mannheimia haemolytica M42548]AGQ26196.1 4'-phosphopantetheinyl transferase [Mannheimia haemolytica